MVVEKKTFITNDGTEFDNAQEAVRYENMCIICDEFDLNGADGVDKFVKYVKNHEQGLNNLFVSINGTDWAKWNEESVKIFIQIGHRVEQYDEENLVNVEFVSAENYRHMNSRGLVDSFLRVNPPASHSWEDVIKVLPRGNKKKYRDMSKFNDNGVKWSLEFDENNSTQGNYVYILHRVEMPIEDKMKNGVELSEDNLRMLVDLYEVYSEESIDFDRYYSQQVKTVVDIDGQNYLIQWTRDLSDYQEDLFDEQPMKCRMETREVMQTVTDIIID